MVLMFTQLVIVGDELLSLVIYNKVQINAVVVFK